MIDNYMQNDEIINELWKIKDDYSKQCNGDFKELIKIIKNESLEIIKEKKYNCNQIVNMY